MMMFRIAGCLLLAFTAAAASWDLGKELNTEVGKRTEGKLQFVFELRSRLEQREGQLFGAEPDLVADFTRVRAGLNVRPWSWIRFYGTAMDARAPIYGAPAPSSVRDPLEWHEGFFEIRPESKLGFGAVVGRQTANYGDTRLIGSPQWAYIPRTYDAARAYWRFPRVRLEGLFLSPVKLDQAGFNKPVLGERVAGTYNTIQAHKHATVELYALNKRQNRPGGFTGVGTNTTNSFGAHVLGPIAHGFRYNLEAIAQTGRIGPLPHRAEAWAAQLGYKFTGMPVDTYLEYKYASGGSRTDRSETFDQLYPAAHDKLGHADLFGWRNVKNWRAQATWTATRALTVNFMYNNSYLADRRDAAYNLGGRPIARSTDGSAGSHLGQEADVFFQYKRSGWVLGAGYGHFFPGEFIRRTTRDAHPSYLYIFQTYSF